MRLLLRWTKLALLLGLWTGSASGQTERSDRPVPTVRPSFAVAVPFREDSSMLPTKEMVRIPPQAESQKFPDRDAERIFVRDDSYKLSAKDMVRITVFHEDELATSARISKDGTIIFPLIGAVKIGGRTVHEAAQLLEARLREYLKQPQISLSILEYAKRRFTILGQVGRPGTFEMPDDAPLNLLEAIGMAGGYTRIANPSSVILKRQVNGQERTFKLNADKMLKKGDTERFEIQPGDTIVVGESLF